MWADKRKEECFWEDRGRRNTKSDEHGIVWEKNKVYSNNKKGQEEGKME